MKKICGLFLGLGLLTNIVSPMEIQAATRYYTCKAYVNGYPGKEYWAEAETSSFHFGMEVTLEAPNRFIASARSSNMDVYSIVTAKVKTSKLNELGVAASSLSAEGQYWLK